MRSVRLLASLFFVFAVSTAANADEAKARSGEEVYKAHCTVCHATGLVNAPKSHDEAAWKARGKTMEQFLETSKKGLNAMPPKGTCMNCTDAELKAAIEFMMKKK